MPRALDLLTCAVLVGCAATAATDIWALARAYLFAIPSLDYGLVGRWLVHLVRGRFCHRAIGAAAPVRGERLIGWTAHYVIGIVFAAILLAVWGLDWLRSPAIGPALIVGIGSATAPFLIMQPGFGLGLAARRAPRPNLVRVNTLLTHAIFGLGLYAAGWVMRLLR